MMKNSQKLVLFLLGLTFHISPVQASIDVKPLQGEFNDSFLGYITGASFLENGEIIIDLRKKLSDHRSKSIQLSFKNEDFGSGCALSNKIRTKVSVLRVAGRLVIHTVE
jgi:hypothetical protein